MSYAERLLLPGNAMLEIALGGSLRYRLRYARSGSWVVSYDNESGTGHRRVVRGRAGRYEFRSVEQLRYDFERDCAASAQD